MKKIFLTLVALFSLSIPLAAEKSIDFFADEVPRYEGFALGASFINQWALGEYSDYASCNFGGEVDAESVEDMSEMFTGTAIAELDLSNFKTSALKNMKNMFADCPDLFSVNFGADFDTSHVTDMSGLFQNVWYITELDLSKFDTSSVTSMASMFEGMESLELLDLSSFKTSSVTNMASMFNSCLKLTKIYVGQGWKTSAVTDSGADMFRSCDRLTGGSGTVYTNTHTDVTYAVIDTPETPGYLTKLGE